MATVKRGTLTPAPQWWRHLRDWKAVYWRRERKAARRTVAGEAKGQPPMLGGIARTLGKIR
jgi:hypothetical protein